MTNLYYQTLYGIVRRIVDLERVLKNKDIDIMDRQEIVCIIQQEHDALLQTVKELLYIEKPENLNDWPVIDKYYGETPF